MTLFDSKRSGSGLGWPVVTATLSKIIFIGSSGFSLEIFCQLLRKLNSWNAMLSSFWNVFFWKRHTFKSRSRAKVTFLKFLLHRLIIRKVKQWRNGNCRSQRSREWWLVTSRWTIPQCSAPAGALAMKWEQLVPRYEFFAGIRPQWRPAAWTLINGQRSRYTGTEDVVFCISVLAFSIYGVNWVHKNIKLMPITIMHNRAKFRRDSSRQNQPNILGV